jgi:hypothetical protein
MHVRPPEELASPCEGLRGSEVADGRVRELEDGLDERRRVRLNTDLATRDDEPTTDVIDDKNETSVDFEGGEGGGIGEDLLGESIDGGNGDERIEKGGRERRRQPIFHRRER